VISVTPGSQARALLVLQSNEKLLQLLADADALDSIVQNDLNATEPANAYQRIVLAMGDAAAAAEDALAVSVGVNFRWKQLLRRSTFVCEARNWGSLCAHKNNWTFYSSSEGQFFTC